MFVCVECGEVFSEPRQYIERHGLEYGPYEEWRGCPECSGAYVEAHQCDGCEEWIDGDYVKLKDGQRFCNDCFEHMEIGDED